MDQLDKITTGNLIHENSNIGSTDYSAAGSSITGAISNLNTALTDDWHLLPLTLDTNIYYRENCILYYKKINNVLFIIMKLNVKPGAVIPTAATAPSIGTFPSGYKPLQIRFMPTCMYGGETLLLPMHIAVSSSGVYVFHENAQAVTQSTQYTMFAQTISYVVD